MIDLDSVELSADFRPLILVELKPVSHVDPSGTEAYLHSLSRKYVGPGKIGPSFRHMAPRLNCAALIVAYDFRDPGHKLFHVYNLLEPVKGRRLFNEADYVSALHNVRQQVAAR